MILSSKYLTTSTTALGFMLMAGVLPTVVHAQIDPYSVSAPDVPFCTYGNGHVHITTASQCQAAVTWGDTNGWTAGVFTVNPGFGTINDSTLRPGCLAIRDESTAATSDLVIRFNEATDGSGASGNHLICYDPNQVTSSSGGDPHFIGFNQNLITYQGECTLILMQSPGATTNGDDVTVHVRTTRKLDFSYISGVAMKIGDDVIEVKPNADIIINGNLISEEGMTMSGLPFALTKELKGSKKMIVSYSFDLGGGKVIDVQANKKRSMMFVRTKGTFPAETTGMIGSPGQEGEMVSRDGKLLSDIDANAYGESWQVKDADLNLFQEPVGPQYPEKCLYEDAPGATSQLRGRRKLMAKKVVTVEEARAACASVPAGLKRELCVEDTIAMGELDLKDDPFYME